MQIVAVQFQPHPAAAAPVRWPLDDIEALFDLPFAAELLIYGNQRLTTGKPDADADHALLAKLGMNTP